MQTKISYTCKRIRELIFYAVAALSLTAISCSVLQIDKPDPELAALQQQRISSADRTLLELENIDTLIKLDNHWLANQFETVLKARAALEEAYSFRKLEIFFSNQIINLESIIDITDEAGNTISASLSGEILLKFRGKGLEWQPHFTQIQISSRDFTFASGRYLEPIPELNQTLLQNLNTNLAQAVVENGQNLIALNPVPLGELQVGASLPGFAESTAQSTQSLRGLFVIAGSAVLIDSSTTSIALDMAFIPDLSTCPADVTVSRAEFASEINSREPVGISRNMSSAADVRYFFSEIAGAKHPLTIIHYWFANGLPMSVEELAVGPSERWRTWSSKDDVNSNATQWEVLVVEKESGCILASKSIHTLEVTAPVSQFDENPSGQTFQGFKDEFSRRTSGFSIVQNKPGIALIEVSRSFLRDVLQAAVADLNIDAEFDGSTPSPLLFSAQIQAFESADITCENRDCPTAAICKTSLTQCKRLRDTRDCSSCQFRNPLNNRCVSKAIDPLCEAARARQNAKYENQREACLSRAEESKQECERLNNQALSSCQIESGFEESACESVKTNLANVKPGTPLAFVSTQTHFKGGLTANFSNFRIAGDLDQMKLDISLQSSLQLDGKLDFEPIASNTRDLGKCIAAWGAPFKSRVTNTPSVNNLLGDLEEDPDKLTVNWSGFGISFETQPSPLESIFVNNPQLLANCNIGLTVGKVEQALAGVDAAFFRGQIDLVLQPLPTKIHLAPATIEFGRTVYSAQAELSARYLKYDIHE